MNSAAATSSPLLSERERHQLRWRSRRGLLENDLLIERFFANHGAALTQEQARGFSALMELADNDLMDIFLRRQVPQGQLDTPEVHDVLRLIMPPQRPGSAA